MMMFLIFITLVSMVLAYFIAEKRGADSVFWVIMALLFGPLALPFLYFSKPKNRLKP